MHKAIVIGTVTEAHAREAMVWIMPLTVRVIIRYLRHPTQTQMTQKQMLRREKEVKYFQPALKWNCS